MSDGDFFREVDDAVRHEQYRMLWRRFGGYIVAVAVLIVLSIAGYKGYLYWQNQRDAAAGAEFDAAVQLVESGNAEKGNAELKRMAEDAPSGYRALARLRLAAADAKAGKTKEAVAAYDAIAGDGSIDPILKDNAIVQAATLRLPEADYAEMERRVGGLIEQNSPWKYSAYDLLGLTAYRLNDMETARKQFQTLLLDQGTPNNLRERSNMMLALIAGASEPGKDTAAKPAPDQTTDKTTGKTTGKTTD